MKKKVLAAMMAVMMTAGLLAGCGSSAVPEAEEPAAEENAAEEPGAEQSAGETSEEETETEKPLRITWVNPTVGIEYWTNADNGAKAAAEEFGVELTIAGPTETNPEQQAAAIDTAVAEGVDGIMTCAWDVAFTASLKSGADAGIPVITVDTDDPDCGRVAFFGTSNYDAGYKAGELMAKATDGKAKICILTAVLTSPTQAERIEGFEAAVKNYPDMEILTKEQTDSDLQKSVDKATACIGTYPECDAFFGAASLDGAGCAKAVEEMGLKGNYTIICFDDVKETINYVKDGSIHATMVQDPYKMAYEGVRTIVEYHKGNKPAEAVNPVDVFEITAENVNEKYPD